MPRGETVERSLFSLWLSCTINNLQAADGCARPSNDVQIGPILGWIVGCGSGPSAAILQASEEKGQTGMGVEGTSGKTATPLPLPRRHPVLTWPGLRPHAHGSNFPNVQELSPCAAIRLRCILAPHFVQHFGPIFSHGPVFGFRISK